jgi:hypothetical protein
VRNPSWQIPYVSCALIAFGLVVQFGISLLDSSGAALRTLRRGGIRPPSHLNP